MTINLRDYQKDCLESIHDNYKQGINTQLIQMATGAGKTVVFANLIQQKNCRTLVVAHTLELLDQAKNKINMICPELEVGLVNAESREFHKQVVVSTIQSARQPENLKQLQAQGFELLIYDEAHRCASSSSRYVLDALDFGKETKRLLTGFTATGYRNDDKGLGEVFQKVVFNKSIKDLIDLGYLCRPIGIKIKTDLDLETVKTENGDFVTDSLAIFMNTPEMNELIVDSFIEHASDRKTVVFGVTVDHAKALENEFKKRGIDSKSVYGSMPQDERKRALDDFQSGKIKVLTNCQILIEGWDCPDISAVIVARPTQSKGLYTQICGRGLRLAPNKKDCLILDFGSKSHSLCGLASLALDEETEEIKQKELNESKLSEFAKSLPPSINKKLKASIIQFDLLGDDFTWSKDGTTHYLKASGDKVLKIFSCKDGSYSVFFFKGSEYQTVAKGMTFDYAFSIADEFAKSNRQLFTVSDLDAPWRKLPISDKQLGLFKSHGFKAGIEDLSRGQAALIISSGVLNKKAG